MEPLYCWRSVLLLGLEGVEGLQHVVAEEAEQRAVQLVGSRLADDVDEGSRGMAVFGGEPVGDDLELLDGVLRDQPHRAAHDVVVEVAAVHAHRGAAGRASARHHAAVQLLVGS
jgi:hypothetical protein